jgi:hypothetical protein
LIDLGLVASATALDVMHPQPSPGSDWIGNHGVRRTLTLVQHNRSESPWSRFGIFLRPQSSRFLPLQHEPRRSCIKPRFNYLPILPKSQQMAKPFLRSQGRSSYCYHRHVPTRFHGKQLGNKIFFPSKEFLHLDIRIFKFDIFFCSYFYHAMN